jgi:hypothetical protein
LNDWAGAMAGANPAAASTNNAASDRRLRGRRDGSAGWDLKFTML